MPMKKCPHCGGEIQEAAVKCKHCGKALSRHCSFCLESIADDAQTCPHCESALQENNQNKTATAAPSIQTKKETSKIMKSLFAVCNWLIGIGGLLGGLSGFSEITKKPIRSLVVILINFILVAIFIPPAKEYFENKFKRKITWRIKLAAYISALIIITICQQ